MVDSKIVASYEKKIGMKIPDRHKIVAIDRGNLVIDRDDGLRVFISDKDHPVINTIRLFHNDKTKVIFSIGIYRGMQIANNYKKSYDCKGNHPDYLDFVYHILSGVFSGHDLREFEPMQIINKKIENLKME